MNAALYNRATSGGGSQQCRQLAQRRPADGVGHRHRLADTLLHLFAWGICSANAIQRLAQAAQDDGLRYPELDDIAALGTHGEYAGNCRRDLVRKLQRGLELPKPLKVDVRAQDRHEKEHQVAYDVLPLAGIVETMYRNHIDKFNDFFGTARVRAFWDSVDPGDPKLSRMGDITSRDGWQDRCIPYTIHGDGAVYAHTNEESVLSIQIKSLLSGEFAGHMLPLFVLPKGGRLVERGYDTADELWRAAIHQLNSLYDGIHARADHTGAAWEHSRMAELAGCQICHGRWLWICWIVGGDLEFLSNELKFPHFNSLDPCWLCPASRRPDAPHSVVDCRRVATFKAHLAISLVPQSGHVFTTIKAITRFHSPGDLQHTGDLGVAGYMLGSTLWDLVYDGPFTGTIEERRSALWKMITDEYDLQRSDSRLGSLTLSMFHTPGQFPYLKGRASENQRLLFVVAEVCRQMSDGSERDGHRLRALDSLCAFYRGLKDAGMFLTPAEHAMALRTVEVFLLNYNWLTAHALAQDRLNYSLAFKHHALWHIAHMSQWINPCSHWSYEFEDFMGQIVASTRNCMHGTPLHRVGCKVMENYLLALHLYLRD